VTAPDIPGTTEYLFGSKLLDEGKLKEAVEAFDTAAEKNRLNEMAFFKRARALQLLGKTNGAISDFGKALSVNPEHADCYCGRAAAYLEIGWFQLAIDDLTEAIDLVPNLQKAFCLRARANLVARKYGDAIRDARSAIRLVTEGDHLRAVRPSPDRQPMSDVDYLLATIQRDSTLTMQGKADLARAYHDLGVRLAGRWLEAEKSFAEAKRLDSHYKDLSAEDQRTASAKNPTIRIAARPILPEPTLPPLKSQAFDALQKQNYAIALDLFTQIIGQDAAGTDVSVWCGRGLAFLGKDDADSAILDFERAINLAPNCAEAFYLLGQAHAKKGYYSRTISDTTQAIRLKPDYAAAYFDRGVAHFKLNTPSRALADLREAIRLDSGSEISARSKFVNMCVCEGTAAIAAGRWDDAITGFETADSADKSTAGRFKRQLVEAHGQRGFDRACKGDFHGAVDDLNKAFNLEKNSAQICRFCGLTCCMMAKDCRSRRLRADERHQWFNALEYMQRAIWLDRGMEYELRDSLDEARRNLGSIRM